MQTRRALAIGLISSVVGLTLLSVSHIHGVSDPTKPHTFGEFFVLAQTRAGFAISSLGILVIAVVILRWISLDCHGFLPQRLFSPYISRAPPSYPS